MAPHPQKPPIIERLNQRQARIGIIGLGYVGLPLVCAFLEAGFKVTGFDRDPHKIENLELGLCFNEAFTAILQQGTARKSLALTSNASDLAHVEAFIICVPTPLDSTRTPDISAIVDAITMIAALARPGSIIALESTSYPGTTEEIIVPTLGKQGLTPGSNVHVVYSPERIDPGNVHYTLRNIPKLVSGVGPACLEAGRVLYSFIVDHIVPVSQPRVAEMAKLMENIQRAVNIALANEMKLLAHSMDIDIYEVIRAAATKPFGFTAYYPGPGLGGHCIPVDPFYLAWKARTYNVDARLIELAGEINRAMPAYVLERIIMALNEQGKAVKSSRILLLGLSYKKNVNDLRESASVKLFEDLYSRGAQLSYSDPWVPFFDLCLHGTIIGRFHHYALSDDFLIQQDCIVLATQHDDVDYEQIARHGALIIDTRGVYPPQAGKIIPA